MIAISFESKLNGFNYYYLSLTIQLNISHLFAHSWIIKLIYFKQFSLALVICLHSVLMSNLSIWSIDRILSSKNTPSQIGPGSNGNEGVLRIPRSSSTTGDSALDCLILYPEHWLKEVLLLCKKAVGIFYSPNRLSWVRE